MSNSKEKGLFRLIYNIKNNWKKPTPGNSIPYKEVFNFCVGGIGIYTITLIINYVTLGNALYIGAALNIRPSIMSIVGVINMIILFLRGPIISAIVDNTKSKYGKFRPYLIWLPIPILLLCIGIGWIPYLIQIHSEIGMLVAYIILFNLLSFILAIYTLAFATLPQVMSKSPEERIKLLSIGSLVYSLGPSILNFILPFFANLFFAVQGLKLFSPEISKGFAKQIISIAGYNRIGTYKWLFPIIVAVFLALGYLCSFGTKERMVLPNNKKLKVKFIKGVKLTFKNKYFWVYNLAQAFMIFRIMAIGVLGSWSATYIIKGPATLGLVNTILGPASVPGMILAPWLIKKFGKKNLQVWTNFLVTIISIISIFVIIQPATSQSYSKTQGYIMVILAFITILIASPQIVLIPAMSAQLYDYQQYKTGDRLEGFLSQFGASVGALFGLAAMFIANNWILESMGHITYDYSVLSYASTFKVVVTAYLIVSAIGGILMSGMYMFWNLSETRHDRIMEVLKGRKFIEDGFVPESIQSDMEDVIERGLYNKVEDYLEKRNIVIPQTEEQDV